MSAQITIGTLIHGTLVDDDLIEAFSDELARVSEDSDPLLTEPGRLDVDDNYTSADVVIDLMDAIGEYITVPHIYFGSIEGDGSDFGYWPVLDYDCETVQIDDENVVDVECNIHIHTNDHGNVTVSELRGAEIWSAV